MVNPRIGSLGHRDAAPLAARSSLRIPHGFAGVVYLTTVHHRAKKTGIAPWFLE